VDAVKMCNVVAESVSLVPKIFWSSNFRLVVAVVGAYVSTLSTTTTIKPLSPK